MKCKRCGKNIDKMKERFVHLEDWNGENLEVETWWHLKCFKDSLVKPETELVKRTNNLIKTFYNNMPKELKKKEVEYVV